MLFTTCLISKTIHTQHDQLSSILRAIQNMVSYYKHAHRDMNLDGIYGLRVLEGQIMKILSEHQNGFHQHLSTEELTILSEYSSPSDSTK